MRAPAYPPDREEKEPPQSPGYHAPTNPQLAPAPPAISSGQAEKTNYQSPERHIDPKNPLRRPEPGLSRLSPNQPPPNATLMPIKDSHLPNKASSVETQRGVRRNEFLRSSLQAEKGSRVPGTQEETRGRSEYLISTAGDASGSSGALSGRDLIVLRENAPELERLEVRTDLNKSSCCCRTPREPTPEAEPAGPPNEINVSPNFPSPVGPLTRASAYRDSHTGPINTSSDKRKMHEHTQYTNHFHYQTPQIPRTTVYSMPATYATAENPLTARQQEFYQRNAHVYSQQVPHYAPLGVIGSAAPPAEGNEMLSLAHTCTCGPSCQCVFCVAHPYNAPTRDRVQSLAHLLPDDGDYGSKSPLQSPYESPFHTTAGPSNMASTAHRMHLDEILHPSNLTQSRQFSPVHFGEQTYSGLPNGSLAETQHPAISSSGYLTMEYEYDLGECIDATGTCRCGDACTCVGCLTHSGHDGLL